MTVITLIFPAEASRPLSSPSSNRLQLLRGDATHLEQVRSCCRLHRKLIATAPFSTHNSTKLSCSSFSNLCSAEHLRSDQAAQIRAMASYAGLLAVLVASACAVIRGQYLATSTLQSPVGTYNESQYYESDGSYQQIMRSDSSFAEGTGAAITNMVHSNADRFAYSS